MRLVLGLGNPGREYRGTRHNAGFAVVELLSGRHGIVLDRARHRAIHGRGRIAGEEVILALPTTFMNLSGEAARLLLDYHGLGVGDLVVVHDEADLPPGTVRIKQGGGLAGHKGLVSIAGRLGSRDFARVRVGIGRPPAGGEELVSWVLGRPAPGEREELEIGVRLAADAVESILAHGIEEAMGTFNRRSPGT